MLDDWKVVAPSRTAEASAEPEHTGAPRAHLVDYKGHPSSEQPNCTGAPLVPLVEHKGRQLERCNSVQHSDLCLLNYLKLGTAGPLVPLARQVREMWKVEAKAEDCDLQWKQHMGRSLRHLPLGPGVTRSPLALSAR